MQTFRLWLGLSCFCAGSCLLAQVSREYDVKAGFLLNFAQFVEWPSAAFPEADTPIVIGILGADPFKQTLDDAVRNEKVRTRKILIEHYAKIEEIKLCHILFVSAAEVKRLPQILETLKGRPILTVSELEGFADRGGMVRLYSDAGKVRMRINVDNARAAHLVVSAKLLRVAEVITNEPHEYQ
jgi:hypothetical protein